jgi:RND family efflux transporter MFP subunit
VRSIFLVVVSSFLLPGCHRAEPDPRTEAPLVMISVASSAPRPDLRLTGVVRARVESALGFRVPGKVIARAVDAGQIVKRGQVLMRLDPNDLTLGASSRAFDFVATRARRDQTAADLKRMEGLVELGAVSARAYDDAAAAAASAAAQWAAAQAQSAVASNAQSYALLVADSNGVVLETLAEPGQIVSAGQPVIKLAEAGPREAAVDLPESYRPPLSSTAKATLYGGSGAVFPAVLRQLSQSADPATRTYEARYVLQAEGASAPLGATVTVQLSPPVPVAAAHPGIANPVSVPLGALHDPGSGAGVWIAADGVVHFRPVRVLSLGVETATVDGIGIGTRIVAMGADRLREGQRIRVWGGSAVIANSKSTP